MTEPKFAVGDIVRSKAGRDKGKTLVVTQVLAAPYVLVCDGDLRKLDRPKRKKLMHLMHCPHLPRMVIDEKTVCDANIRKHLIVNCQSSIVN